MGCVIGDECSFHFNLFVEVLRMGQYAGLAIVCVGLDCHTVEHVSGSVLNRSASQLFL
jgi:hypothetical protein